jgi:hypothetical protein
MEYLKPIFEFIVMKFPVAGVVVANAFAISVAVSVLIEIVELIALWTPTKKDDEALAKAKPIKDKVIAVLELFPHVNIPAAAIIVKIAEVLKKVLKIGKAASDAAKDK